MIPALHPFGRLHTKAAIVVLTVASVLAVGGCAEQVQKESVRRGSAVVTDLRVGPVLLGPADGYITQGGLLSAFEDDLPAVRNLDRDLKEALRRAVSDASSKGVEIFITTGWRSERYQRVLFDEAVTKYGSETEARKWVKTPEDSSHVHGDAVDLGPTEGLDWLSQRGAKYGLCQTYGNEMWHYELAVEPGGTCPTPRTDASAQN